MEAVSDYEIKHSQWKRADFTAYAVRESYWQEIEKVQSRNTYGLSRCSMGILEYLAHYENRVRELEAKAKQLLAELKEMGNN